MGSILFFQIIAFNKAEDGITGDIKTAGDFGLGDFLC